MQSQLTFPEEEWRPVVGWEGFYEVSNLGRVRRSTPGSQTYAGRILKGRLNAWGYKAVRLYPGGKWSLIARLTAQAFIPNPDGKPEVNHKNGTKTDNQVANLEWMTGSENVKHAFDTGLKVGNHEPRPATTGHLNGRAKLTDQMVAEIKASTEAARPLAKRFGVSRAAVRFIRAGKTWRHVPAD
jgi:hypothetical protein